MHVRFENREVPSGAAHDDEPGRSVRDTGEHALIDRIRQRLPPAPEWVRLGIGDDAAVLVPERNRLEVLTTDAFVEHVHFSWAVSSPSDVGFKALAVNLSDLAAMGAAPRAALLSLVLPGEMPLARLDGLLDGLLGLAAAHRLALVGGNISRSPGPLVLDLTVLGTVKPRRVLTRSGARPGDELYVSGWLGMAAAALDWHERRRSRTAAAEVGWPAELTQCIERWLRPEPRLHLGMQLGRNRAASACVDLSDGLSDGARQIARASDVGITIDASAVPVHEAARRWFESHETDPLARALVAGEDYELLFTVPRAIRRKQTLLQRLARDLPISRIGIVTAGRDVVLRHADRDEALPAGFTHF
jgi:thiamine-monophosphate kinase